MNELNIESRLVRYGELIPCKTAFIDTHTPGSNQKENFTIIGSGVSENPEQHVHINIPHGFNIGAAGQPPKCNNSLHSHRTAEVFFVLFRYRVESCPMLLKIKYSNAPCTPAQLKRLDFIPPNTFKLVGDFKFNLEQCLPDNTLSTLYLSMLVI